MKIKNWMLLVLIAVCLLALLGYRALDSLSTDSTPPQLTFDGELLPLSVHDSDAALLQGVAAQDDTDGDVTASVVIEKVQLTDDQGLATVTYAAFDQAGNVAKATRQVQYTDYQGPRFSLSAPLLFTNSGFNLLRHISVTDPVDGDISHRIRATSLDAESITQPGVHDVMLRVTNSMGHTAELVLPVEVISGDSAAKLELTEYLVYLPKGTSFRAEDYLKTFSIGKTVTALDGNVPYQFKLNLSGEVDTAVPGVYAVNYSLNQTTDSWTYTAVSKLIVVVEE